jgi:hypothetical protein
VLVAGRRAKLAVIAAGAATVLAGCGIHPGAAAVVGSETISQEHVDDVATAVCSANLASARAAGQQTQPVPSRKVRELAVQVLVETEIARQFGEHEGVEPNAREVSRLLAQNDPGIAMLPEAQQEDLRTAVRESVEGQLMLVEVGRRSLGEVSDDRAYQEGSRLLAEYVETIDVELDPRYGRFEDGAVKPGGTDLSVAASERARSGNDANLPASQQCR